MVMATFIDNARRQMEKGVKRRPPASHRSRILCHALASVGLLFFAHEDSARAFIVVSSILVEMCTYFVWTCRNHVLQKPKSFHFFWTVTQFLGIVAIQQFLKPPQLRQPGLALLSPGFPSGTSGDPRVLVGPTGVLEMPYDINVGSLMAQGAKAALEDTPYTTGDDFSVIIVVRDEDDYIAKTVIYTFETSDAKMLKEIIVVDDGSAVPVDQLLDKQLPPYIRRHVRVIRMNDKEGLIRARIVGANMAEASNILFLDGHCRPKPGWLPPLLKHLKANYKRLACPVIQDINKLSWEDVGTSGFKMMFEWTFEFGWYDNLTDEVPLSAGGIFAMTKKWWKESGEYDKGMLEWGGENLEQSFRIWLCGGEIFVVRQSFVGHIFDRPPKPNPENKLVTRVQTNQKRGALVWLDDYYKYFERFHPVVKSLDEGSGLDERFALRQKLRCKPFQWYVDKFRTDFQRKGLLVDHFTNIRHSHSRWCLTYVKGSLLSSDPNLKVDHLALEPCKPESARQKWQVIAGNRMIYNAEDLKCLDLTSSRPPVYKPILKTCEWNDVMTAAHTRQFWQFDAIHYHRIFSYESKDQISLTGNDDMPINVAKGVAKTSFCLTASLSFWSLSETSPNLYTQTASNDVIVKQPKKNQNTRDIFAVPCESPPVGADAWLDPQAWEALDYINDSS